MTITSKSGSAKAIIDCQGAGRFFTLTDYGSPESLTLANLTIKGCGASAGRITSTGAPTGLTLANIRFEGNTNSDNGGALFIAGANTKVRIVGCTFAGNYNYYLGGAIFMDKGKLWVLGTLFDGNKTSINNTQNGAPGIHALGADVVMRDTVGTNNSAAYLNYEFIYLNGGNFDGQRIRVVKQPSALYFYNCTTIAIDELVSLTNWTPLYAANVAGTLTLTNSLMQGPERNHVYLTGSGKATVTNVKWRGGKGTALQTGMDAIIKGIEISNWEAQNVGVYGAMFNCGYGSDDVVDVKDSVFRNIKAESAPVMFGGCGGGIDGCLFEGNSSLKDQGALVVYNAGTIKNSMFLNNKAAGGGGAMRISAGVDPTPISVENCLFAGNTAANGGAILVTVAHGSATQKVLLRGITATGNSATGTGGGMHLGASGVTVEDSIVWGNSDGATGGGSGDEIYVAPIQGYAVTVKRTLSQAAEGWFGDPGLLVNGGAGFVAGQLGNLDTNPLFAAGPKGAWYLAQKAAGQGSDSPAVDPVGGVGASSVFWGSRTTRTDGKADASALDFGWHYGL